MKDLVAVGLAVIFLIVGVVGLVFPKKIQTFTLSYYDQNVTAAKMNPFVIWMKGPTYVLSLRFVGVLGILGFLILVLGVFRGA